MNAQTSDTGFSGSIPAFYERYLVPLIFAPYAADLAARALQQPASHVLEVAAGRAGAVNKTMGEILRTCGLVRM